MIFKAAALFGGAVLVAIVLTAEWDYWMPGIRAAWWTRRRD